MKNTICSILILLAFVFTPSISYSFFGFFGNKDITLVKEGLLEFNKRITVAEALEGHKFLITPKWESIEDNKKRKFVHFYSKLNMDLIFKKDFMKLPVELLIEFTVNRDNTFDVNSIEYYFNDSKTKNENSKKVLLYKATQQDIIKNEMISIYSDAFSKPFLTILLDKSTSLFINSIEKNLSDEAKFFLEHGANPETKNEEGKSVLELAVIQNNKEIVKRLLDKGANADNGFALHIAVEKGYKEMMQMLLEKVSDINKKRGFFNVLEIAIQNEHKEFVPMLLAKGADPKSYALAEAVKKNYKDITLLLLDKGADPNLKYFGDSLVKIANNRGYEDMAQMLLDKGASNE